MSDRPVWIRLVGYRSGARYDNRDWPAPGEPFQVPEWEAHALIKIKEAVPLSDEELAGLSAPKVSHTVEPVHEEHAPKREAPRHEEKPAEKAREAPVHEEKPAEKAPERKEPEKSIASDAKAPERPAQNASKAEWVAYAISQGHDEASAQSATKAELQARYGGRL